VERFTVIAFISVKNHLRADMKEWRERMMRDKRVRDGQTARKRAGGGKAIISKTKTQIDWRRNEAKRGSRWDHG
jgi:hypothetical protein